MYMIGYAMLKRQLGKVLSDIVSNISDIFSTLESNLGESIDNLKGYTDLGIILNGYRKVIYGGLGTEVSADGTIYLVIGLGHLTGSQSEELTTLLRIRGIEIDSTDTLGVSSVKLADVSSITYDNQFSVFNLLGMTLETGAVTGGLSNSDISGTDLGITDLSLLRDSVFVNPFDNSGLKALVIELHNPDSNNSVTINHIKVDVDVLPSD